MSDDPNKTLDPVNTPRKALAWLWTWSMAHTMICSHLLAGLAGFIIAKLI